ncbi:MAG: hypothetical protein ABIH86_07635 [Planctomycetota bacterium]
MNHSAVVQPTTNSQLITSEAIKAYAKSRGADDVGIANIERWEGAPPSMDPREIWPDARSVVVMLKRIPRGTYRGIEEGTHWNNYTFYSYNRLNTVFLPTVNYETACFIEDFGWEAVPLYPGVSEKHPNSKHPKIGRVAPDINPQVRIAGVAAGLGEIGWSKVFLHPYLGPRLRLCMILTDAVLEPDPIRVPQICDLCRRCATQCPGNAIPKNLDHKVSINVGGQKVEWGDVHMGRCTLTHHGLNREASPFLAKDSPHLDLNVRKSLITEEEAYRLTYSLGTAKWQGNSEFPTDNSVIEYYRQILDHVGYFAICGAKGCIRECMIHLEETNRIGNQFKNPFRKRRAWKVPQVSAGSETPTLVPNPEWERLTDAAGSL